jgi:hydroxymethylglutaryl-CoA reductase
VTDDRLHGELALPLPLGTVGGAAGIHPTSTAALALLGSPGAERLARIAACVGLAQNLSALFALVTEGIQRGHMGLHAERLAWAAGARGDERRRVVEVMRSEHRYGVDVAAEVLARLREEQHATAPGPTAAPDNNAASEGPAAPGEPAAAPDDATAPGDS